MCIIALIGMTRIQVDSLLWQGVQTNSFSNDQHSQSAFDLQADYADRGHSSITSCAFCCALWGVTQMIIWNMLGDYKRIAMGAVSLLWNCYCIRQ